jgi:hypothetical protein
VSDDFEAVVDQVTLIEASTIIKEGRAVKLSVEEYLNSHMMLVAVVTEVHRVRANHVERSAVDFDVVLKRITQAFTFAVPSSVVVEVFHPESSIRVLSDQRFSNHRLS